MPEPPWRAGKLGGCAVGTEVGPQLRVGSGFRPINDHAALSAEDLSRRVPCILFAGLLSLGRGPRGCRRRLPLVAGLLPRLDDRQSLHERCEQQLQLHKHKGRISIVLGMVRYCSVFTWYCTISACWELFDIARYSFDIARYPIPGSRRVCRRVDQGQR